MCTLPILERHIVRWTSSVHAQELRITWVMQQHSDPEYTNKSTSERLKKQNKKDFEWPSQCPDLNLIKLVWYGLKKFVHA